MKTELKNAISNLLLTLADDELILAHRNSEWTGHGPILEEDIAFTNIALDEMGHAHTWYKVYAELNDVDPDQLAFFREAADFRNVQMVELPIGDWAFSMLRQYLFDAYELIILGTLAQSQFQPIADAAAKIRTEEMYHLRHTQSWVARLGLGTAVSQQKMQVALDELWPYAQQLFTTKEDEALLRQEGVLVTETAVLVEQWHNAIQTHLTESGLTVPQTKPSPIQRHEHTAHLAALLTEMQSVARLDPQAQW